MDPQAPSLTVFERDDEGEFAVAATVAGSEQYTTTEPYAVTVVPGDLLR